MPSRFRTASGKRISFFSFQDIITSVTGILILITLMLSIYMEDQAGGQPVARTDQSLAQDLEARAAELRASTLRLREQMNRLESVPSVSRVSEERRELEATLKRLESSDVAKVRSLADQHDGLLKTNSQMQATSEQLQVKLEQLKKKIAQKPVETNTVFVIKGLKESDKTPFMTVVSGNGITVERLGATGAQRLGGDDPVTAFRQFLSGCSTQDDSVIFIVRPSGIPAYKGCKDAAEQAGFVIGHEPVAEDWQGTFQPERTK